MAECARVKHVYLSGKNMYEIQLVYVFTGNIGSGKSYFTSELANKFDHLSSGRRLRYYVFHFSFLYILFTEKVAG